jgi:Excreted virulence factor EspC, type VII ESX diderm
MPRIEADPGQLTAASSAHVELAGQIMDVSAGLASAAGEIVGAAGSSYAASSMEGCALSWLASLEMLADSVDGYACNLGAAASAYEGTDRGAMPR